MKIQSITETREYGAAVAKLADAVSALAVLPKDAEFTDRDTHDHAWADIDAALSALQQSVDGHVRAVLRDLPKPPGRPPVRTPAFRRRR